MAGVRCHVLVSVLVAFCTVALDAGGWVVITVTELPDSVVTNQPLTITYAVRQHGMRLLGGLDGRVEAPFLGDLSSVCPPPPQKSLATTPRRSPCRGRTTGRLTSSVASAASLIGRESNSRSWMTLERRGCSPFQSGDSVSTCQRAASPAMPTVPSVVEARRPVLRSRENATSRIVSGECSPHRHQRSDSKRQIGKCLIWVFATSKLRR